MPPSHAPHDGGGRADSVVEYFSRSAAVWARSGAKHWQSGVVQGQHHTAVTVLLEGGKEQTFDLVSVPVALDASGRLCVDSSTGWSEFAGTHCSAAVLDQPPPELRVPPSSHVISWRLLVTN
jgi:hypothetical protein